MGADALRYFLLREVVFGQDGSFSYDALVGPLQLRSRQRPGQPRQPHPDHDPSVPRGRDSRRRRRRRHRRRWPARPSQTRADGLRQFRVLEGLEAIWSLISAVDKFIVERRRGSWRASRTTAPRSSSTTPSTPPPKRCASSPPCSTPCSPNRTPQNLGAARHDRAASKPCASTTLAWGGLPARPEDRRDRRRLPAHRSSRPPIDKMRELEDEVTAAPGSTAGQEARRRSRPKATRRKSPSTISSRSISASAWCSPREPRQRLRQADAHEGRYRRAAAAHHRGRHRRSLRPDRLIGRKVVIVANLQPRKLKGIESNGMIVAASVKDGKPVLAGFHEDIPVGAKLK